MSNEIQQITFSLAAVSGSMQLVFNGQTTSSLTAGSDTAATIQTALQALSTIGSGNILVFGDWADGFALIFAGSLANTNVTQVTVVNSSLVGASTYATWNWADTSGGDWGHLFTGNNYSSGEQFEVDGTTFNYNPAAYDNNSVLGGTYNWPPWCDDSEFATQMTAIGWTLGGGSGNLSGTCNTAGSGHSFDYGLNYIGDHRNGGVIDDGTGTDSGEQIFGSYTTSFTDGVSSPTVTASPSTIQDGSSGGGGGSSLFVCQGMSGGCDG